MTVAALEEVNDADEAIFECLQLDRLTSFYLYAGAGSGKTRSLVAVLERICEKLSKQLQLRSQRIAVITYTNAACDEIQRRLDFNPLIAVSTIHTFSWNLIAPYSADIRNWLKAKLQKDIEELDELIPKTRPGTATLLNRQRSREKKTQRLAELGSVKRFVYSPAGDLRGRDALDHSEVIQIATDFLLQKPTLQRVLVGSFPILLIDESQDTNKHLMDALLEVQRHHSEGFCIGLFGDAMQRIYFDGKVDLVEGLPDDWKKPSKVVNYRCPKRVIRLINKIRLAADGHQQEPAQDAEEGLVRFFVADHQTSDKQVIEEKIALRMKELTGDEAWPEVGGRKTLTLEHHMAAKRMGFDGFFSPLYKIGRIKTSLLEGTLPELRFFTADVLPLVSAIRNGDKFAVSAIVRTKSPLLSKQTLRNAGKDQSGNLTQAKLATCAIEALWNNASEPSLFDVLKTVAQFQLFEIPERLTVFVSERGLGVEVGEDDGEPELAAWREALNTPFSQIAAFNEYVSDAAPFGTHQGVKGLEFPRVLVVLDDSDAGAAFFSYEKLFGVKEKSETDLKNEKEGADTSMLRTNRLFYVTCSRAEKSLAIVAYTENSATLKQNLIDSGLFGEGEIEFIS